MRWKVICFFEKCRLSMRVSFALGLISECCLNTVCNWAPACPWSRRTHSALITCCGAEARSAKSEPRSCRFATCGSHFSFLPVFSCHKQRKALEKTFHSFLSDGARQRTAWLPSQTFLERRSPKLGQSCHFYGSMSEFKFSAAKILAGSRRLCYRTLPTSSLRSAA